MSQIELLSPAGSMANLKAAVQKGADAVYLGMKRFSARDFATNFNKEYLKEAVNICRSNNVKLYLAMNTLVKNHEIDDYFSQLSYAYSKGIDAVIIQEPSFIKIIKSSYPDLRVHMSTQAGVMNSAHASLLSKADRITLARELSKDEIITIRKNFKKELEIFCHGALCVSVSGSCLFSSLIGGRSGNRGKCAQPCRKRYNNQYLLSTKELCLINKVPEIEKIGINAIKIEGRMRTPYYVATVTEIYRKALDSYYEGSFQITKEMQKKLEDAFSREFTSGWFEQMDVFNPKKADATINPNIVREEYKVQTKDIQIDRKTLKAQLPTILNKPSKEKLLLVRVYNENDAIAASENGADIIYFDLFKEDFEDIKRKIKTKMYAVTPRIMLDSDKIGQSIKDKKPDGILAGNLGILSLDLDLPIHLDYCLNVFNDIDIDSTKALPIISPELSINELRQLKNKNIIAFVHGKARLMTLRHRLKPGIIMDERKIPFMVNNIPNGTEIINQKEFGLLSKSCQLLGAGINKFYIDTEKDVGNMVKLYRNILDGKKIDDEKIKNKYILAWAYRGVI